MGQERYRDLVRQTAISEPQVLGLQKEKTLAVEGLTKDWDCWFRGCYYVALYMLRAALENQCSTIQIRRGAHHRHDFDVVVLLNHIKKRRGGTLPRPKFKKRVPAYWGTWARRAVGGILDKSRPTFQVLVSLSPSTQGGQQHG